MMKGIEFKLMLGVLMLVTISAILIFIAFDAKTVLAGIDKIAPWLHLGDGSSGGGTPGGTTATTLPPGYFQNSPAWKSGDLSISNTLKWAASDVAQEAGCKNIIEGLFNPATGNFKTFIEACKFGSADFKFGPFDLGSCKVEAGSLMNYIFSDSACRAQVGTSGFDQRAWLLPSKKCGEAHRDPFDKIRYNCGIDNVCTGKVWLYYDKTDKGVGICDENIDVPRIKDTDTTKNVIIGWIDNMISDSEKSNTCRSVVGDCTMLINIPEPGLPIADLATRIKENFIIDMKIVGVFPDGSRKLDYGNGGFFSPYVRDGIGLTFSFDDPKPMDYQGIAVPCASPKSNYIAYNCGADDVCKGDMRVTYACGGGTNCDKTNRVRYLGICEKP